MDSTARRMKDLSLNAAPPSIHINGEPQVDPVDYMSLVSSWIHPSLPPLENDTANVNVQQHLDSRLYGNAVSNPIDPDCSPSFWPLELFNHLFDRKAISDVVNDLIDRDVIQVGPDQSADMSRISWTETIYGDGRSLKGYRLVLAILISLNMAQCIESFVAEGLGDEHLPLELKRIKTYHAQGQGQPNSPFSGWRHGLLDNFHDFQYRLLVPTLAKSPSQGEAHHYHFHIKQILPWVSIPNRNSANSANRSTITLGGGYGEVKQIVIHAWQHFFHETLRDVILSPLLDTYKIADN